jgi:hypothetical protein
MKKMSLDKLAKLHNVENEAIERLLDWICNASCENERALLKIGKKLYKLQENKCLKNTINQTTPKKR